MCDTRRRKWDMSPWPPESPPLPPPPDAVPCGSLPGPTPVPLAPADYSAVPERMSLSPVPPPRGVQQTVPAAVSFFPCEPDERRPCLSPFVGSTFPSFPTSPNLSPTTPNLLLTFFISFPAAQKLTWSLQCSCGNVGLVCRCHGLNHARIDARSLVLFMPAVVAQSHDTTGPTAKARKSRQFITVHLGLLFPYGVQG